MHDARNQKQIEITAEHRLWSALGKDEVSKHLDDSTLEDKSGIPILLFKPLNGWKVVIQQALLT